MFITHKPRRFSRSQAAMAAFSMATVLGLGLAGCSSGGSSSDGKTLTVQVQTAQAPAFQHAADLFEESHPGVTVKLQTVTDEQKQTTNAQILASGNAPDIGVVPSNSQPYFQLVKANKLVPVDDLWKDNDLTARYGSTIADSLKWDGKSYLTLFDLTYYNVVFYNKDAFAKAGITAPADHRIASDTDLYSMVDKLKSAGYEAMAVEGKDGYQFSWMMDAQLQANAPKAAFEDLLTSWQSGKTPKTKYTSPDFTDSVQNIADWNDHGLFAAGSVANTTAQAQAQFESGTAAMLLGGNWYPAGLKTTFDYDWLLLPGTEDGASTVPTLYTGDTLAIPTSSKNQDLAKEFLGLYNSDDVQKFAASNVGSLPAVNTVSQDDIKTALGPVVADIVAFAQNTGAGVGWASTLPSGVGQSTINPLIAKLVSGQASVSDVGEQQQQAFDSYKSSNQ